MPDFSTAACSPCEGKRYRFVCQARTLKGARLTNLRCTLFECNPLYQSAIAQRNAIAKTTNLKRETARKGKRGKAGKGKGGKAGSSFPFFPSFPPFPLFWAFFLQRVRQDSNLRQTA